MPPPAVPPPRPPAAPFPLPAFDARNQAFTIERRGMPRAVAGSLGKDLYHFLVRASWPKVIGLMAVVFFGANLIFAGVLYLTHAEILNCAPDSFLDRYWFSVQTMATIGYGYMAPIDHVAGAITAIESFCGILLIATATGVSFAKFSRPSARVMFSLPVLIADHDGERVLMFRMANARTTAIVEAQVKVTLIRDEVLDSGERVRRLYDLALRRATSPSFALSWSAAHVIDAASVLSLESADTLARGNAALMITFTGIDDRLAATVHARHTYTWQDFRWDHHFVDIIGIDPATGGRYIDYRKFDDSVPVSVPVSGPMVQPAA